MRYEVTIKKIEDGKTTKTNSFSFDHTVTDGNEDLTALFDNESLKPMIKNAIMIEFESSLEKTL